MPRGDGAGPNGMGRMTGRKSGYCAGFNIPGYMNNYMRIRRCRFFNQPEENQKQVLEDEIAMLEGQLKNLKERYSNFNE